MTFNSDLHAQLCVNLENRCYCLHPNGPYRHFRWNRPETEISTFIQLSRELRDQIYSEYISLQKGMTWSHWSLWSLSPCNQNRCAFGSCEIEPFPSVRVDFPLLFANRQIRSELQKKLVQQRFSLHFDCCCTLDHFLENENNIIFKNSLQAISFHWKGLQSDRAIIQLQKLPNLKRLTIHITQSIPLNELGEFIFQEMGVEVKQDYICKVTHAVGFDELCSIRGLNSDVKVKIGNEMCFTQEEVLSQYFSKFLTRAQPPDYGEKLKLRVPYEAWSMVGGVSWIGADAENTGRFRWPSNLDDDDKPLIGF